MATELKHKKGKDWTVEDAADLFDKAEDLSRTQTCDYMGELLFELGVYPNTLTHVLGIYPQFKSQFEGIKSNCEVVCWKNLKTGQIPIAAGIFNLKINHKWQPPAEQMEQQTIKVEGVSNDDLDRLLKE